MPQIINLSPIGEVLPGDSLPIFDESNGDTRRVSVGQMQTYMQNNLDMPDNSDEVNFLQAGTGAVQRSVQSKLRDVVSVKDFGAVGDGVTDDTAAIIAALAAVPVGGTVVGSAVDTYLVSSRFDITSRTLKDINLKYGSNTATILLIGNASLQNVKINANTQQKPFAQALYGYVNLHNASGAVIKGLTITNGAEVSAGIFCSTKASYTTISDCNLDQVGFGIFFRDYEYPLGTGPNNRIVDGVTYTGTIGRGLSISNCELGNDTLYNNRGDGIEIDARTWRFSEVSVSNCRVFGKNSADAPSGSSGLLMGFANIDRLQVTGCMFTDGLMNAGALHVEVSTGVVFANNVFNNCWTGIGVGSQGTDHVLTGNSFNNCKQPIILASNAIEQVSGVIISSNTFVDTTGYPLQVYDSSNVMIHGNIFKNVTITSSQLIYLYKNLNANAINNISIRNNTFMKTNAVAVNIIDSSAAGTVTNVFTKDNNFIGFDNSALEVYRDKATALGLCEEYFPLSGATLSGMIARSNADPTGYITPATGDFCVDVVNGTQYRWSGSAWVALTWN